MIDFNSHSALSDRINFFIDASINADRNEAPARNYLGASIIGHVCDRHVQYQYLATQGLALRKGFPPRTLRIFDRGNIYEEVARQWLKNAGFLFGTTRKGKGFSDYEGKFKGHVDGILTGWKQQDTACPIVLPVLWENKCLGAKNWKKVSTDKLKIYSSTYYAQVQIYMHYLELERCLFTAVNADTMELYHEIVPFNQMEAALYRTRADTVIYSHNMLPRVSEDPAYYICKWCDFSGECRQCS